MDDLIADILYLFIRQGGVHGQEKTPFHEPFRERQFYTFEAQTLKLMYRLSRPLDDSAYPSLSQVLP
jgi:hypothetical protein